MKRIAQGRAKGRYIAELRTDQLAHGVVEARCAFVHYNESLELSNKEYLPDRPIR